MHRPRPNPSRVCLVFAVGTLFAPATLLGSDVNYTSCPGYPFNSCSGYPAAIPENSTEGVWLQLNVPFDSEYFITDVQPWFYITHTYQGDLHVLLLSPDGTSVDLINRPGLACGSGFSANDFSFFDNDPPYCAQQVCRFSLSDSAAIPYNPPSVSCPGIAGVNGAYRPFSPLSAFDGQSKVGTWWLFVQDLAFQDTGNVILWGITIRTEAPTPPVVDIATPEDFACSCAGAAITGTATDPDGTLTNYRLEWAADSAGPWNLIATSSTPVTSGTLGTIPAAMPEGFSYLRLIATNALGQSSAFSKVIYADDTFSGAGIVSPQDGDIVGGAVCTNRISASDSCFASAALAYAPQGGGFTTFFSTTNLAQSFPSWNTIGLPDGNYTLRVTGTTTCGNPGSDTAAVIVDNTAPVALISAPQNCDYVGASVPIIGTASDAHLSGWSLSYTGGPASDWVPVASGNSAVNGGLLANWNTAGLPACTYTLRLIVSDAAVVSCGGANVSEYLVSVDLGAPCDVNDDGAGDFFDIDPFLQCLFGG